MLDRYTKAILTVIAVALTVSVIQRAVAPAEAQGQACGTLQHPCVVVLAARSSAYSDDFTLCTDTSSPCMVVESRSR
ncbi:hypothetical protein V5F53_12430 [Xanthobacter sp. V4C-4]|uniref:hypothetical protein n=1 Tax=Xanthobacter cornucopiae TaxID=3119924 RepID=UPI00372C14C3